MTRVLVTGFEPFEGGNGQSVAASRRGSLGGSAAARGAVRGKELRILGHSNFALTAEERGRAHLELLGHIAAREITIDLERFPLERVADAWECQRGAGKAVVEFSS